jgi:hypothetical protein
VRDRSDTPILLATALLLLLLAGCAERQQIIEQTVGAKADDVAAEAESSHVPEQLLTWEMVAEIDPGFEEATAVAFDARGDLYVAGDEAVRKMTADGQVEWEIQVGGTPTCLEIAEPALYVGLQDRVETWGMDGQKGGVLAPESSRTWITSIAVAPTATYVADAGNRRVLRYEADGAMSVFIAKEERGIPAFSIPSPHLDVAVSRDRSSGASAPEELVVVNPGRRSIQYHSMDSGALLRSWDRSSNDFEGFGGCCNPTDIALLPDGRIVTSEKGIPRVKVYSKEGELLSVVAPPEEFRPSTSGIDMDATAGRADADGPVIAVLDPERGMVRLYEEMDEEQVTRTP